MFFNCQPMPIALKTNISRAGSKPPTARSNIPTPGKPMPPRQVLEMVPPLLVDETRQAAYETRERRQGLAFSRRLAVGEFHETFGATCLELTF